MKLILVLTELLFLLRTGTYNNNYYYYNILFIFRGSIMEKLTYAILNTFSEIQKGNDEVLIILTSYLKWILIILDE